MILKLSFYLMKKRVKNTILLFSLHLQMFQSPKKLKMMAEKELKSLRLSYMIKKKNTMYTKTSR